MGSKFRNSGEAKDFLKSVPKFIKFKSCFKVCTKNLIKFNNKLLNYGVSEMQFCTTECPQLFEFEVANCKL